MCFLKSEDIKHKKSDADVDCYKLMYLGFYSGKLKPLFYCSNAEYSPGDRMSPAMDIADEIIDRSHVVNGGVIHSYTSFTRAKDAKRGFLSMWQPGSITIVHCVIPAGTSYWENDNGEYISKELIIKEILE